MAGTLAGPPQELTFELNRQSRFCTAGARHALRRSVETPTYQGLILQAYPEVHEKVSEIVSAQVAAASTVLDLAAAASELCLEDACGTHYP